MESIIDFIIQFSSNKYVLIFLSTIGTMYVLLTLLRGLLTAITKLTKTEKDDKIINTIYNFLDTYGLSFNKLIPYSKIEKNNKKMTKNC